jgi:hypothetical protein
MTISRDEIFPDTHQDLIGAKIKRIQRINGWKGKAKLRDELVKLVKFHSYKLVEVRKDAYLISRVGESYQYVVPNKKRGLLEPFRGKRVRLVCIYNGRWTVTAAVGVIQS